MTIYETHHQGARARERIRLKTRFYDISPRPYPKKVAHDERAARKPPNRLVYKLHKTTQKKRRNSQAKKIGETHTQRCINVGRKTFPFAVVKCTLFSFGATGSNDLSLTRCIRCIVVGRVPKKSGCPKNFVALFGPPWMGRVFFFFVYWCECVFDLGQLRWCCERRRDDDQQSWPTEKCNAIPLVPPSFSALFGPSTVSVCLWGFGLLFIHFFHISAHSNKSVAGGELVFFALTLISLTKRVHHFVSVYVFTTLKS